MYNYTEEKPKLFTDEGQRKFLEVRDKAKELLKLAGAFRMQEVMGTGDSLVSLACVDRLVELGEICEVTHEKVAAQHRVFIAE